MKGLELRGTKMSMIKTSSTIYDALMGTGTRFNKPDSCNLLTGMLAKSSAATMHNTTGTKTGNSGLANMYCPPILVP